MPDPKDYVVQIQDLVNEQIFGKEPVPTSLITRKNAGKPFIFSSDYMFDMATKAGNVFSVDAAKRLTNESLQNNRDNFFGTTSPQNFAAVTMVINPSSIRWSQGKRTVQKDTMAGATFFHFSDKAGQNNDILKLEFTGNTGNIWNGQTADPTNQRKLFAWHMLYRLSREPMKYVLEQGGKKIVKTNRARINYQTQLFPTSIELTGFFNRVLEFEESAESPFNRQYTFGFTVTSVSPSLDAVLKEINPGLL